MEGGSDSGTEDHLGHVVEGTGQLERETYHLILVEGERGIIEVDNMHDVIHQKHSLFDKRLYKWLILSRAMHVPFI